MRVKRSRGLSLALSKVNCERRTMEIARVGVRTTSGGTKTRKPLERLVKIEETADNDTASVDSHS